MDITFEPTPSPDEPTGFVNTDLLVEPHDNGSNGDLICEQCGTGFAHTGRGRKPKRCTDCRESKPSARSRSTTKSVDTLIEQITGLYVAAATGMQFIPAAQFDGMVIANNASKMAESWRPLIERDNKVRKFWERMTTGGGWGTVIFAHGMVAMAIMNAHNVQIPGLAPRVEVPNNE